MSDTDKRVEKLEKDVENLKKEVEMFKIFKNLFAKDDSKLDELKQENKAYKKALKEAKQKLEEQKQLNSQLSQELQTLQNQNQTLQFTINNLQNELDKNPLKTLQDLYNSLDTTTKDGINNILVANDTLDIFAKGILNIEPIWDYLQYLNRENKDEEFDKLRKIFEILFKSYMGATNYRYQEVKENDEFDSSLHIRDNDFQEFDGNIKEIILKGITKDGEIVRKSIVRL